MKVLLYMENYDKFKNSGLGKAVDHQIKALKANNIPYTLDPNCTDYDIAHINFYGLKSYRLAKKAHKMGKKVVYHAHSTEEDFRNSFLFSNLVAPLFKKWISHCYRQGDYIITPTPYSKQLLENYHLDRPIVAISNGIEMEFFEHNTKNGKKFRKEYGFTDKDKIIMGVGLYIERKGILDFVELAKRLPQYHFVWCGFSPLWASPKKIRDAVNTKLPNLHFLGYVEPANIKNIFSGANLYLFPTLEETEGIPILEACTAKLPALIRDIPVFSWLEDGKTVYKAKNVDEFERKIIDILEGKLPNLTEAAYYEAEKRNMENVGKQMVEVYNKVLENKK